VLLITQLIVLRGKTSWSTEDYHQNSLSQVLESQF